MGPIVIGPEFWGGLLQVLENFMGWLTEQVDGGMEVILQQIVNLVRNVGFITQTDQATVRALGNLIGMNQVLPLADAVLQTALLLGAAAYAGHHYFGWRGLPDTLQRWFVAMLLTRLSLQLQDWSLTAMDGVTHGLSVSIPDFPHIDGVNPLIVVALLVVWAVLLFRLVLVCAKRIAWLVVLYPIGPLAMMFWAIPQTQWIANTFVKLWVGWLIGQFFVVLAIAAMELMVNQGGIAGYFLSCACLVVATEAISLFAPTGDAGLFKVGPIKV